MSMAWIHGAFLDRCPGAGASVCYTQKGTPLVRCSAAVNDSRTSAEASAEWTHVNRARACVAW